MLENKLTIEFTVDPRTGHFNAKLPNGAEFQFTLEFVGGKLGSNLQLFRDAVKCLAADRPFRPLQLDRGRVEANRKLYDESAVRRFTPKGNPELTLADLGLDFGEDL